MISCWIIIADGPEVRQELILLLRYLKQCMYFSKKPYSVFLDYGGYGQNDVLIKKSKARVRKYQLTLCCQLCVETQHPELVAGRYFSVHSTTDNKSGVTGRYPVLSYRSWSLPSQLSVTEVANAFSFSLGGLSVLRSGWQQQLAQRFHFITLWSRKGVSPT